jgi:hypothetical protein
MPKEKPVTSGIRVLRETAAQLRRLSAVLEDQAILLKITDGRTRMDPSRKKHAKKRRV